MPNGRQASCILTMSSTPLVSPCPAHARSRDELKEKTVPTTSMRMKDGG
jgi:hypothetical protein